MYRHRSFGSGAILFPRNEPEHMKKTCIFEFFVCFSLFREEQGRARIGRRNNNSTGRARTDFHFAAFRMSYEIFPRNRRRNGEKWEWGEGRWKITRLRWSRTWLFRSVLSAERQSCRTIKGDQENFARHNAGPDGTTPIRSRSTGKPCGRRSARCVAGSFPIGISMGWNENIAAGLVPTGAEERRQKMQPLSIERDVRRNGIRTAICESRSQRMFCSRNCYFEFRYGMKEAKEHEWKDDRCVSCLHGSIFNVAVDIRPGDTFGYAYGEILSFENQKQMSIPRGFAHGYLTLEDDTLVQWCVDNDFCGEAARAVRYDSDFIWQTKPWPVREYILSEKDRNAIKLSELRKFWACTALFVSSEPKKPR